ncbi:MAG: protein translocase subunit SecF [Geminicoccaceae bacterium]
MKFRFLHDVPSYPFLAYRRPAMIGSAVILALALLLVVVKGLNFGIDFRGGILIETRSTTAANLTELRSILSELDVGEVALQEFGAETDVLIRIERQQGDEAEQLVAVEEVKAVLTDVYGDDISFRRVEFVGPKVGEELLIDGLLAVGLALGAVLIYIWLRFEWQFGVGAVAALAHDVILTLGLFALTGMEFNLSTVAAVLTIVGYSLNDTVVVFDRVRENLRRYKKKPLTEVLDLSINETLARTLVTGLTTLLALAALYVVGPAVIGGFTLAMIWGVIVGTYSSIFIAAPVVLMLNPRREEAPSGGASETAGEAEG